LIGCVISSLHPGRITRELRGFGGKSIEPRGNPVIEGSGRVIALGIRLTRRYTGQQAQTLIDGLDRENPEPFLCGRGDNALTDARL
jgi:hypothetical protein